MTHHSAQDIAVMTAIPNMRCYLPSDRFQTKALLTALLEDELPAYIRVGRNPIADIYAEDNIPFALDKATVLREGSDITIIACGEMVSAANEAGERLAEKGISARVLDMYCIKPIDRDAVIKAAHETKAIITIEEHGQFGGMGAIVSQIVASEHPVAVKNIALPDSAMITGTSREVFDHYELNAGGIVKIAMELMGNV
jgi:transketolase